MRRRYFKIVKKKSSIFLPLSKKKKKTKRSKKGKRKTNLVNPVHDVVMFVMKQGTGTGLAATLVSAILAQPDAFRHHHQPNWIAETAADSDSMPLPLPLLATLIYS
jgi:hypothetical protein